MTPETQVVKVLEQCMIARIEKLENETRTLRHFVYCHCDHAGAYNNEICGKCELLKYCWPPRDYGRDFPEVEA